MLRGIAKIPVLRHNTLLKRCNLLQTVLNIRNKQSTVLSKDQRTAMEADCDDDNDKPLSYSQSEAATMTVKDYRQTDDMPWYQPHCISLSLAIFLIYFCILREENDIDLMLNNELSDHFKQFDNTLSEKTTKLTSK